MTGLCPSDTTVLETHPMRIRRHLAVASFLMLAVAVPSVALAEDSSGSAGAVTKVEVNTPSADAYLQYFGRVFILSGKVTTEYRWGGTSCGTRVLDSDTVDLLARAAGDTSVVIAPKFQAGQGDVKCIVGFSVAPKR
jgi:hypothetical protein